MEMFGEVFLSSELAQETQGWLIEWVGVCGGATEVLEIVGKRVRSHDSWGVLHLDGGAYN